MDALVAAARAAGVEDERVLSAIAAVPRSEFVPGERVAFANLDAPIPIPHEQVTSQPSLVARMVEALALEGEERVLEVGTGYGWQTALLARLAREVFSVERFADLAGRARRVQERPCRGRRREPRPARARALRRDHRLGRLPGRA
jgi:protein-L-isoaspartate(D-aspartate) O-methyltransferase